MKGQKYSKGTMLFEYEIEAPLGEILGNSRLSDLFESLSHELDLDLIDARIEIERKEGKIVVRSLTVKGFV
ncbi:MAG TPA: hypothetical protein EYP68_04655 [Candidatus Korarchaeota archaeon]|nr:hypothetical protein [Candidatus Korarchaeota archaeon]